MRKKAKKQKMQMQREIEIETEETEKEIETETETEKTTRNKRKPRRHTSHSRAHFLVPYIVVDGTTRVLLGCRQRGVCFSGAEQCKSAAWDLAASDVDAHAMPPLTAKNGGIVSPIEAVARAGFAAFSGVMGSAVELQRALTTDARVRVPGAGGGYAYMLCVRQEHERVATQFNAVARYITSVFGKDADGSLLGAPSALLAFSHTQWVDTADLRSRVAFSGASSAAKTAFASASASSAAAASGSASTAVELVSPVRVPFRHALTPRALEVLRAVLPALEACAKL